LTSTEGEKEKEKTELRSVSPVSLLCIVFFLSVSMLLGSIIPSLYTIAMVDSILTLHREMEATGALLVYHFSFE
jgi:hypothetical protein